MTLEKLRWQAEYVGFRLVACVIDCLSVRQVIRCAETMAWVMTRVVPKKIARYEVAKANLKTAFGNEKTSAEIDQIIYRMWVHLFRLVAEIIQFPRKLTLENCRESVVFRNRDAAVVALNSGRPVFVLGGHFGNWEASMAAFGVFGFKFGVVARKLDNPYLHKWFTKAREGTGHKLLLKQGGWDGMVDILEHGGNLGLLCDQDAGRRGVFVDFFGKPASTNKSLALMAIEYNALIVVGYGRRLPDHLDESRWVRYEIGCEEIIDPSDYKDGDQVREITEHYSRALERVVRRAPEQYFWVHRRWKSEPGMKRKKKKKAQAQPAQDKAA